MILSCPHRLNISSLTLQQYIKHGTQHIPYCFYPFSSVWSSAKFNVKDVFHNRSLKVTELIASTLFMCSFFLVAIVSVLSCSTIGPKMPEMISFDFYLHGLSVLTIYYQSAVLCFGSVTNLIAWNWMVINIPDQVSGPNLCCYFVGIMLSIIIIQLVSKQSNEDIQIT